MKIRTWGSLFSLWAFVFLVTPSTAEIEGQLLCQNRLDRFQRAAKGPKPASGLRGKPAVRKRTLEEIQVLHLLTYNLLNLEQHVGKFQPTAGGYQQVKGPNPKEDGFRREQAEIILGENTDIGIFEEIEGMEAFRNFNDHYIPGLFEPLLKRGNDGRGIEVGMLVRRDLPFEWEYRSQKDRTWHDPIAETESRVFSRDLPTLILRVPGNPKPFLILLGTHFKSKRDRNEDPESHLMRQGQAEAAAKVIAELKQEFGATVAIVLAGDFNGNFNHEESFATMRKALDMEDPFNVLNVNEADRITHTYHPRGEEMQADQLDYLLVSRNILACLKTAYVYRYKDADGNVKPIPQTMNQRKRNPSDHFPVAVQLDFPCLLAQWRKN